MIKHIGIVACSSEGASLCYRTICAEGAEILGDHAHPEITMHTPPLSKYVVALEAEDWNGVGDLMLASAEICARAGADFLICPDNTIHNAFNYVAERSPLPWLHIADVVAEEAQSRGFRRLAVTGTRWLTLSDIYPGKLESRGIDFMRPDQQEIAELNRIIMDELTYGIFRPESIRYYQDVIERLKQAGCDGVVLGCTEFPLILEDSNSPLPTFDSTRLLARAALAEATRDASPSGSGV